MELAGGTQRLDSSVRIVGDRTEPREVEPGAVEDERDRVAVAHEPLVAESGAQRGQRASQRATRALRIKIWPQQVRDHRAAVRVSGDREKRKHRDGLAGIDCKGEIVDLDERRSK